MKNYKFEDLLKVEKSFVKPVLENIHKSLKMIFEGKQIRLVGSDFDKNIMFYVNQDLKSAKFDLSEGKLKVYSIEDIKVDADSFKQQFENLMSEAIDDLAAEKINEAESKFGKAVEVIRAELSGGKIDIFTKRPPLLKESKVAIKKIVKHDNKADMKVLAEKAKELNESYYGKPVVAEEYYEISEGKAKKIENMQKEPSLLFKVVSAKKEAATLDISPMLENVEKFIADHEEVFFITSDKIKAKLDEAAKKDVSATKEKVLEVVAKFKKMRNESKDFRNIVKAMMNEQAVPAGELGQAHTPPEGVESDLDDKVVSDMDRKAEEDKLGFMTQFVDILEKLFQKIKEVGADDEDVGRRADFALDTIAKAKEEGKWDKDELSEIAREAIEVAAKLEGIEPDETALSKAAEEEGEEEVKDQETIDAPQPEAAGVEVGPETDIENAEAAQGYIPGGADENPPEGEEEEENLRSKEEEEEIEGLREEEDINITSDGDITYDDQADDEEQLNELNCFSCNEKFAVKKGRGSYKCPYCSEEVNCDMEEEVADGLIAPGQEEEDLDETGVPINNIHPQELEEAKKAPKGKPFVQKAKPQPMKEEEKHVCKEGCKCSEKKVKEEGVDIDDESSEEEVEDNATAEIEKQNVPEVGETPEHEAGESPEFEAGEEEEAAEVGDSGVEVNDVSMETPAEVGGEEKIEVSDTGTEKEIPIDSIKAIIVKTEEEPEEGSQEAFKEQYAKMQLTEDPTGSIHQDTIEEAAEMKTTPQPGKMESAGGEELKTSGKAFAKKPAVGKIEPAGGIKMPESGEKMSKFPAKGKSKTLPGGKKMSNKGGKDSTWPKVGKVDDAGGEEITTSGPAMSANPSKGTMKVADGSSKIADSGEAMKRDATVGKVETLKESEGPESAGGEPIVKEQNAQFTEQPIQQQDEKFELAPAPAKNADVLATYRSSSNPDHRYYIVRGKDNRVYCTCPGWRTSSAEAPGGKNCKHLKDFHGTGTGVIKEDNGEVFIRETEQADEAYPAIQQPAQPGQNDEMDEKYMGFKKLVHSLKSKGVKSDKQEVEMTNEELNEGYQVYLKEGAEALAAWIGRKKYGKEKFQKMSAKGKKK